jgi:dipeptidyl aminopeptidase/acylaminoacyl peptidase
MMTDLEDALRATLDLSVPSLTSPARADPTAVDESLRSPDWSPDGQRFTYIAGAWRGESRIVIARAKGGVERVLSFPDQPSAFVSVRWSPDGDSLAVTSDSAAGTPSSRLDIVTLATGAKRMLLDAIALRDIRWAPDSGGIFYLSRGAVSFVDAGSGEHHEVYRPAPPVVLEPFSTFDLSHDAGTFLLATRSPGVKCAARMVTKAGAVRDLPPFPGDCRAIAWVSNGKAVLASAHGPEGSIGLWLLPLDAQQPHLLVQPERLQVVHISVRPGMQEALIGAGNPRPNVWKLSGFAPGG